MNPRTPAVRSSRRSSSSELAAQGGALSNRLGSKAAEDIDDLHDYERIYRFPRLREHIVRGFSESLVDRSRWPRAHPLTLLGSTRPRSLRSTSVRRTGIMGELVHELEVSTLIGPDPLAAALTSPRARA
jgi:hypothetical protein